MTTHENLQAAFAGESQANREDLAAQAIHVCDVCGHTALGAAPEKCPVCGAPASRFMEVP